MPYRLAPSFPQRKPHQRAYFREHGLEDSDFRVFRLILECTINSTAHTSVVALSFADIAARTRIDRRTAIRSVQRLRDADLITTARSLAYHEGLSIALAPRLISDTQREPATNGTPVDQIFCEDGIVGMRERVPDHSTNLMIVDLPFGITRNDWDIKIALTAFWTQSKRVLKPNCPIILTASDPFDAVLKMSNPNWYRHLWVWEKVQGSNFLNASFEPMSVEEFVLVFCESGAYPYHPQLTEGPSYESKKLGPSSNHGEHRKKHLIKSGKPFVTVNSGTRQPRSILEPEFPRDQPELHPTQKPVALFEYLLRTYSNEGDVVLDCCIGSGTTAIAAINTNRRYIGFEKDPEIYQTAISRIEEHRRSASTTHIVSERSAYAC